jgi:peptide/nickel transport system permease protein
MVKATTPSQTTAGSAPRLHLGGLANNWKLFLGLALIGALVLFSVIGSLFVPEKLSLMGAGRFNTPPSAQHLLGTESTGRDVLAEMIYGIPRSLEIGLIAGTIGIVVGTTLGMISGYYRGTTDSVVRSITDIALVIPSLAILVVIASVSRSTTIEAMAFVVAIFAWAGPTRTIRSQSLSLRERPFASMASLSGQNDFEIIFFELLPNLLPYIMAGFVGAVSGAILASVGLQLLGLGPLDIPNLGMMLQTSFYYSALLRGQYWWFGPPILALIVLFLGMFLISVALDEYANPRLRGR